MLEKWKYMGISFYESEDFAAVDRVVDY